jgi:myosin heavy subunit
MKGSSVEFFNSLFKKGLQSQDDSAVAPSPAAAKKPGPAARGKKVAFLSVGSQFRAQLQELMGSLSETNPYFIRCIKPNPQKVRGIFNRASVNFCFAFILLLTFKRVLFTTHFISGT